jgi:hypothetical protein
MVDGIIMAGVCAAVRVDVVRQEAKETGVPWELC